jgi:hypothetical protein
MTSLPVLSDAPLNRSALLSTVWSEESQLGNEREERKRGGKAKMDIHVDGSHSDDAEGAQGTEPEGCRRSVGKACLHI